MTAIGVLGLGTYLPPTVRTNDWWPSSVVDDWHNRIAARVTRPEAPTDALSAGARRVLDAMAEYAGDPFRGAVERRVMSDGMTQSEMEAIAGREAMQRAGVRPDQIDVILTQTPIPEHLLVNTACVTHRLLELPRHCIALGTEGACNAFAMHFSLAQALIASGQARHVLSVHSSAITRIQGPEEPDSAWWGDGAAAVVIGPVADGKGLLAANHNVDGASSEAVVLGIPGKRWWQDGPMIIHARNREHTRAMLMNVVDRARDCIGGALATAGIAPSGVDFYASHQGTAWFTRATASLAGLDKTKTLVTYPSFGNMANVSVPLILAMAEREGMIRDGSVVVTFSGGAGETWSSLCLGWGR